MNFDMVSHAADFLDISVVEAMEKLNNIQELMKKAWKEKKSMEEFYKTTDLYIFDLIKFNTSLRLTNLIHPVRYARNLNILDFGGGIGEVGMQLSRRNKVFYYDIGEKTAGFAKYISEISKRPITILTEKEMKKKKYDLIIASDVLEHLDDPLETVNMLSSLLTDYGLFLTTGLDFAVNENLPMHLEKNRKLIPQYNNYMNAFFKLLFYHVTRNELVYLWQKK
jgi:2-polyprenyl-3-methyl-5-hydroxy-6-metoxy-1,4-benzoquinol methylase